MCTLVLLHKFNARWPLIVLANRDEYVDRAWDDPARWTDHPNMWAGRDRKAGGTWLGINRHGVLVGLTNRYHPDGPRLDALSRGDLPTLSLGRSTAAKATSALGKIDANAYNGFNMVVADIHRAFTATNRPELSIRETTGEILLLGNDSADAKVGGKRERLKSFLDEKSEELRDADGREVARAGMSFLSHHEGAFSPTESGVSDMPICVHTERYGTVCSQILLIGEEPKESLAFWTRGPVCRAGWRIETPFKDA